MHEGWSITAQLTLVVPLVYLVEVAAGHEGHAAWATQRIRAVSVRKPDAWKIYTFLGVDLAYDTDLVSVDANN